MKKINKMITIFVLLLVLAIPMFAGCDLFNQNNNSTKTVLGISIYGDIKTNYLTNEEFDANGAKVIVTYEDNSTDEVTLFENMTNFDSSTAGKKALTITYKGKTTTKQYRVDKIKLAHRYTYRYEGYLNNYSFDNESENQNLYIQFNTDDTCVMHASSTMQYLWSYSANGNIQLTSEISGPSIELVIVSSNTVRIQGGEAPNYWIQVFRCA